ncbi:MAG: biotin/lipoyl-containing protein, partial [Trueperaceae bacterium]
MPEDVKLPELAESVVEGEVLKWLVAVGDAIVVDQPLVEVMTDKVTVELPSPLAGVLAEIVAAEGAVVAVGGVLARIQVGAGVAAASAGALAPPGGSAPAEAAATPAPTSIRTSTAPTATTAPSGATISATTPASG